MDRAKFFAAVRGSLFGGKLQDTQVKGMEAILDEWVAQGLTDIRWLAYMFATAFHETGQAMQPVTEYGGRKYFDKYDTGSLAKALGNTPEADGDGWTFRGRGLVQITGRANYRNFGIENDPDRALDDRVAVKIMFTGMTKGSFTGRKLSDFFTSTASDWVNARRIINRLDRAQDIAGYAKAFNAALEAAR